MNGETTEQTVEALAALQESMQDQLLEHHNWCRRLQLRGCLQVGLAAAKMGADADVCVQAALRRWRAVDGLWAAVNPAWTPPAPTSADLLEEAIQAMHCYRQEQFEAVPTHLIPTLLAMTVALRNHLQLG